MNLKEAAKLVELSGTKMGKDKLIEALKLTLPPKNVLLS